MIDEKKLIPYIKGWYSEMEWLEENAREQVNEALQEMKESILRIIDEQPKTDWIPCEERFPKINEKVLVTIWCHRVEKGFLSHTGKWFVITEDGIDEATVIAWQPLPQPYKKEGAE